MYEFPKPFSLSRYIAPFASLQTPNLSSPHVSMHIPTRFPLSKAMRLSNSGQNATRARISKKHFGDDGISTLRHVLKCTARFAAIAAAVTARESANPAANESAARIAEIPLLRERDTWNANPAASIAGGGIKIKSGDAANFETYGRTASQSVKIAPINAQIAGTVRSENAMNPSERRSLADREIPMSRKNESGIQCILFDGVPRARSGGFANRPQELWRAVKMGVGPCRVKGFSPDEFFARGAGARRFAAGLF